MKNNLGVIILVAVALVAGFLFSGNPVNLGGGIQSAYLVTAPTQATTSVGVYKSNIGNPTAIVEAKTNRINLSVMPKGDIYIWLTNSTSSSINNGSGVDSSGIFIASGTDWNMKDYGIIWPGVVYGMASTTTSTVQTTDYLGY